MARSDLLGGGVLGDSLGSFRHSVLGQFSGQEKPDSSLDFPRGDGCPLVVEGKTGSFSSDALEDVIDEGVHDGHGLAGNTGVGVDLLQHLVDVDGVGFTPLLALLFVALGDGLLGLTGLLGSFSGSFGRHFYGNEKFRCFWRRRRRMAITLGCAREKRKRRLQESCGRKN